MQQPLPDRWRRRPQAGRTAAACCLVLVASAAVATASAAAAAAFTPPALPLSVGKRAGGNGWMGRQQDGGGDGLQQQQQRAQRPVSVSVAAVGRQQQQRGTRLWMAPITNARANFVGEEDEEEVLAGDDDPNSVESVKRSILAYIESRRVDVLRPVLGAPGEGDLGIQWLPGGSTNYCFRVYNKRKPETMSLFVKHAKDFVRGFSEWAILSRERVWYDAEGIKELSKYLPTAFPKVYLCEPDEGLLACEWLEGYHALSDFLRNGNVVSRTIAPSLARMLAKCHAQSYHPYTDDGADRAPHAEQYPNQMHIDFWSKCVFPPLLDALADPMQHVTKPEVAPLVEALNRGGAEGQLLALPGRLQAPIQRLWHDYQFKKQSLIHADLHCKNILVRGTSDLKVVDCEKWMSGPAGLDVGQLLANYAWYIATFAVGCDRRGTEEAMRKAVVAIWFTYTNEFRQALNKRKKNGDPTVADVDTEAALEGILLDAQGFLGMWTLFLCIACPVEIMEIIPPSARDTCQHTDPTGFRRSALTNIVCMAAALLVDYEEGKAALASNHQQAQQQPSESEQPDSLPSERKLFRAAEEASVRDMVVDKNEARAAALIDSYRSQSRTDPRRLLGVVTEGVYYSPSMNPQDWGYQLRG